MPVDLTSTWIPLSLLAVLSLYMFMLFRKERRESLALEASGGHMTALDSSHGSSTHGSGHDAGHADSHGDAHASDHSHSNSHGHADDHGASHDAAHAATHAHAAPAADHAHAAPVAETSAKKPRLLWRTAHIWLPIAAGFGWQAYIDFIRPMLDKAAG